MKFIDTTFQIQHGIKASLSEVVSNRYINLCVCDPPIRLILELHGHIPEPLLQPRTPGPHILPVAQPRLRWWIRFGTGFDCFYHQHLLMTWTTTGSIILTHPGLSVQHLDTFPQRSRPSSVDRDFHQGRPSCSLLLLVFSTTNRPLRTQASRPSRPSEAS